MQFRICISDGTVSFLLLCQVCCSYVPSHQNNLFTTAFVILVAFSKLKIPSKLLCPTAIQTLKLPLSTVVVSDNWLSCPLPKLAYLLNCLFIQLAAVCSNISTPHLCATWQNILACMYRRLNGGELFDYLTQKDFLDEVEATQYMKQILEGMEYVHSRNIVHLDLKVKNACNHAPITGDTVTLELPCVLNW